MRCVEMKMTHRLGMSESVAVVREGRRHRALRREPARLHGAVAGDEQAGRRHGAHQHVHQGQLAGAHAADGQRQGRHVHLGDGKE